MPVKPRRRPVHPALSVPALRQRLLAQRARPELGVVRRLQERPPDIVSEEGAVELAFDWEAVATRLSRKGRLRTPELMMLILDRGKVSGRTMMQKQVFLAYKEVFGPSHAIDPGFRPDRFGPFSQVVADLLTQMKFRGIIRVTSAGEGHSTYFASDQGRTTDLILSGHRASSRMLDLLATKKALWDEWTPRGVMQYVYRNYPEFATRTAIPSLIWD